VNTDRTAEIEADIERQREHLADTVDALTHKLDVKAQAKERASHLADLVTTSSGRPRPELVAGAVAFVVGAGLMVWWRRR
jgi:hypothetical protein